jgi:homoserine O-acetyltransferase/O-succinyltransferase
MNKKLLVLLLIAAAACFGGGRSESADPPTPALLLQPDDPRWQERAPEQYRAVFETNRGNFVIEVTRSLAPLGADRFYNLVRHGYYDGVRFHRSVENFVQFGLHGDPAVNRIWKERYIPDDRTQGSNLRGTIAFAMVTPDKRSTQVYINRVDFLRNDNQGFSIFGRVVSGMEVVDSLYSGYGERSGGGLRAGRQAIVEEGGNDYLRREYPLLDYIVRARIVR